MIGTTQQQNRNESVAVKIKNTLPVLRKYIKNVIKKTNVNCSYETRSIGAKAKMNAFDRKLARNEQKN